MTCCAGSSATTRRRCSRSGATASSEEGTAISKTLTLIVTLGLIAAPLVATASAQEYKAQQAGNVPRLGILWPTSPPAARVEEFRRGLRELGYLEGQNVLLEYRYAEGRLDRLPELATELVQLRVDIIVALSTLVARPAQKATSAIPIVAVSGDPVGLPSIYDARQYVEAGGLARTVRTSRTSIDAPRSMSTKS